MLDQKKREALWRRKQTKASKAVAAPKASPMRQFNDDVPDIGDLWDGN